MTGLDEARFREVLGHFATGITVVTALEEGEPVGFTCQSFAALSLDPPMVILAPARSSTSWPRIREAGAFCVNILEEHQEALCRTFAVSGGDKFDGVGWSPAGNGAPILHGVLAWAACTVESVHEAGDHFIVIARVSELGECAAGDPLLFYRGRFTLSAATDGDAPPEVVDTLLAWPRHADWM